jgi:hypothetical protein
MTDRALQESQEIIRIPLGAADESRIQSGRITISNTQFGTFDQVYVNCFPVVYKDPLRNDTSTVKLVSRYGINYVGGVPNTPDTAFTNPNTTSPVAMQSLTMLPDCVIIAFWDSTDEEVLIYEYNFRTAGYQLVTTITGFTGSPNVWITEINVNNVCNIAVVVDNGTVSEAWNIADVGTGTLVGGTVAQYTGGGNFPTELATPLRIIGPMLQMNTYVFALASDGYIYNCELSGSAPDLSTWNVLGKVEVSSQPDGPVRMIRYKHHILVLGSSSIEFFNFDSTITAPASPLAATNQAYINFGCVGTNAAIVVDDTLFWVAASKDGALGLWRLDGYSPVQLSGNFNSVYLQLQGGDINLQVIQMHGQRHLITNATNQTSYGWLPYTDAFSPTNATLTGIACYCIDTGVWWQWAFEDPATVGYELLVTRCIYTNGQVIVPVSNYGHVPIALPTPFERADSYSGYDAFNVKSTATIAYFRIPYLFMTNTYDFETSHRKTIHRIKLLGDIFHTYPPSAGLAISPFYGEAVSLWLIATRMDQANYNPAHYDMREINVRDPVTDDTSDTLPQYTKQYEFRENRFGHGRRWKFGFAGNFFSPFRFDALEVTVQKGAH